MILAVASAVLVFYVVSIWWFLHRMGDKHGSDKRLWVRVLDGVLLTPLLPVAYVFGLLINRKSK